MKAKVRLLTAIKIWMVIYPSITFLLFLLGKELSMLPLYQQTFMLTIILVPWMVFIGLPLVERLSNWFSAQKAT